MPFLSRVALVATFAVSLAGLAAPAAMVQAAEPALVAAPATVADSNNPADLGPVPAEMSDAVQPPAQITGLQPGDAVAYPTLAAAVAAQRSTDTADEQLRCLATSVYYESQGEPLAGQLAVAQVILNRMAAKRFGESVCGVVTQRGQFSFVRGGRIPAVDPAKPAYRTAVAVAKVALAEAWDSPAPRALYFNARRAPFSGKVRVAAIGNHIFYR